MDKSLDLTHVEHRLFKHAESDEYVKKVANLLHISHLELPVASFIRRCWFEGMPPRECARGLWQVITFPYAEDSDW